MDQLPLEVLECIVAYLSDEDLSRCCAVSTSWREVFSDNTFWRKRCNIKLSDYLKSAKCFVEPFFTTPCVQNSSLMPLSGWRLSFLREQHYLKNLRSGRYKVEEIKIDFGIMVNLSVNVEFVGNDYVFLQSPIETQVWNVAQKPNLVMKIPFQWFQSCNKDVYQFHENKLIIVQCNVVQMLNICLHSKTWSFHRTFFYDKPEKCSLNITKDTDVNDIVKNTCHGDRPKYCRTRLIICGNFLIGINTIEEALQNPVMHIWDLNSCTKIKEEICSEYFGSDVTDIYFSSFRDKTIVVCGIKPLKNCFAFYSLANLKFLALYQCPEGESLVCNGYWFTHDRSTKTILRYDLDSDAVENVYKFDQGELMSWGVVCDKIVVMNYSDVIFTINPISKIVELQPYMEPIHFLLMKDKYVSIYDRKGGSWSLWEYRGDDSVKGFKQNTFTKLFSVPHKWGMYRNANEVMSKIVLAYKKFIVLNFW